MDTKSWIEIAAAVVLISGPILVIGDRLRSGKGIGARIIQLLAVLMVIPAILILALEGTIDGATAGTLFGTLIGFVLSDVGSFQNARSDGQQQGRPGRER